MALRQGERVVEAGEPEVAPQQFFGCVGLVRPLLAEPVGDVDVVLVTEPFEQHQNPTDAAFGQDDLDGGEAQWDLGEDPVEARLHGVDGKQRAEDLRR